MGRYSGVRLVSDGVYEINFQIDKTRKQYRVKAASEKEAYLIRCKALAHFENKQVSEEVRDRPAKDFRIGYRKIREKLKARNRPHKTILHYKKSYWRVFYEYRMAKFPSVKTFKDLTPVYFDGLEEFFVNELGIQWRAEKTYIDAIVKKLSAAGFICDENIVRKLKEMGKPPQIPKEYPNVDEHKLEKMFEFIKSDRPDFYRALKFMKKTGRRVEETTLYRRTDVVWEDRIKPMRINVRPSTTKVKYKQLSLNDLDKELEELIINASKGSKEPYLFLNRKGKRLQQSKIRDYLKKVSREYLGVEITPHFFRHRFMTLCALNGIAIKDAMAIAGISDYETAMRYYQHSTPQGRTMALEIS